MQWLIDIAKDAMEQWIYENGIYRTAEPGGFGFFGMGDLIFDTARHTLDFSATLPDNTKAINLSVIASDPNVGRYVRFMHPDAPAPMGRCILRTQVANLLFRTVAAIGVNSDKQIDYMIQGNTWTQLAGDIRGIWL